MYSGAVEMAYTGRPPKQGARFPCGKLKRQADPDHGISQAAWQRIREDGLKYGLDPRLGTELGRLALHGEITNAQAVAGFRMAELCGRIDHLHGKRRSVASPSYMAAFRGDPDIADERLTDEEREKKLKDDQDLEAAHAKMLAALPDHPWQDRLERLVCENERPAPQWLNDIRWMLDELAKHFRERTPNRARKVAKTRRPRREDIPFSRFGEGVRESRAAPSATNGKATAMPARRPADPWLWASVRRLRPDLDDDDMRSAVEIMQALRDRERFRADKKAVGR